MNLDQAIKIIISENGVDILKERRFIGNLYDRQAFNQLPYAKNVLCQIYDHGFGPTIHKLYCSKDMFETTAFISDIHNRLGFDIDMIAKVLNAFSLPVQKKQKQNNGNVFYKKQPPKTKPPVSSKRYTPKQNTDYNVTVEHAL